MKLARAKTEREGACRACGSLNPETAHLWPRSLGATGFDNPDVTIPLCRRCHTDFDAHKLDVLPLLTLPEQLALVAEAGGIQRAMERVRLAT